MKQSEKVGGYLESGILQVAGMMEIAARTAPKSRGEDYVQVKIIAGREKNALADDMVKFGEKRKKQNFDRDARNLRESTAAVLIGIKGAPALGLDCGACGYLDCASFKKAKIQNGDFKGPICSYRLLDLGIALGSAVKTAQMFNVDNRIMYRVGVVARHAGLADWDYVMGIPLSATGKNIFFDRELKQKAKKAVKKH